MLSEGSPVGTFILKIEARDADLNPKLRYYLTGHGAEHLSLDIDTGNFHVCYNIFIIGFNKILLIFIEYV